MDPHREIYFIPINCAERLHNQLAQPDMAEKSFETVRHRPEKFLWWPDDFFEHRRRQDESRQQKAIYIQENPVRKNLVGRPEDWPFVYFEDGKRSGFLIEAGNQY